MTLLRASNSPISLDQGKPISSSAGPTPWIRPADWITYTPPTASEEKVVGTVAVWNQDSNYLAVNVTTTDASQYTVDWGDGTSTDHNSGTTAEKNYTWSSISSGTVTSDGYRQAIVTITPTTAGKTFLSLSLSRISTGMAVSTNTTSPWLDITISAPNATGIEFGAGGTAGRIPARMLENLNILSCNITQFASLCREMSSLQNVNIKSSGSVINADNMFTNCFSLRIAPALSAPLNTITSMFLNCYSLQYVPLYTFGSALTAQSMFQNCQSLETVPLFNTANITNFALMFSGCYSLKSIPNFNFSGAQTFNTTFSNCYSLESFPATNTGSFLSNTSGMFQNCYALKSVGLFNVSGVSANISSMFFNCISLETVPAFNFSTATTMANFFGGCTSLKTIPDFNLGTGMNTANGFFNLCRSLREIPELNLTYISSLANNTLNLGNATIGNATTSLGRAKLTGNKFTQSLQNCLLGATQLDEMYTSLATLNPAITNASGTGTTVTYTVGTANIRPFIAGRSVTITGVTPIAYNITGTVASVNTGAGTFTVTNAATGTYVSGGVATITSDVTITVTGNPGVATDNPGIATAKGWTVVG